MLEASFHMGMQCQHDVKAYLLFDNKEFLGGSKGKILHRVFLHHHVRTPLISHFQMTATWHTQEHGDGLPNDTCAFTYTHILHVCCSTDHVWQSSPPCWPSLLLRNPESWGCSPGTEALCTLFEMTLLLHGMPWMHKGDTSQTMLLFYVTPAAQTVACTFSWIYCFKGWVHNSRTYLENQPFWSFDQSEVYKWIQDSITLITLMSLIQPGTRKTWY